MGIQSLPPGSHTEHILIDGFMCAVAGPDRPVAQPTPKDRVTVQNAEPGTPGSSAYGAYSAQAQDIATSAAATASSLYSRLGAALAERT